MTDLSIMCSDCGAGLMKCILTDQPMDKIQIRCICGHCGGSSYNIDIDKRFFPGAWSDNSHIDVVDMNRDVIIFINHSSHPE